MKNKKLNIALITPEAFKAGMAAVLFLLNLFIVFFSGYSIYKNKQHYEDRASITSQNLSRVLNSYLCNTIDTIDFSLLSIQDEIIKQLNNGTINYSDLKFFFKRQKDRIHDVDAIRMSNAQGDIVIGSVPGTRVNISDRDFFTALRDNSGAGLIISRPVIGRITGEWTIYFARRINMPDGSFGGAIWAVITINRLTRLFSTIDVGANGGIALRDENMSLIARYPDPVKIGSAIGDKNVSPVFRQMVESGKTSGTFKAKSPINNIERIFSFNKFSHHSIYTLVGLATQDYLADWWKDSLQTAGLAFVFIMISVISSLFFYRGWKRERDTILLLASQEEKFHTVADYTYDWEFWISPDGTVIYTSPSCKRITGYDAENFYSDPSFLESIVHPDDREKFISHRLESHEVQSVIDEFIYRIIRSDGSVRWLDHSCQPIVDESGIFRGKRGSSRDITDRKAEENERLRLLAIIESSLNEIYVFNTDTLRFEYVSSSALSNLGFTMNQILEKTPLDIKPEFNEKSFRDLLASLRAGNNEKKIIYQTVHLRSDGTRYPVESHLQLVSSGDEQHFLAIIYDITERKKAESQMESALAALKNSEEKHRQLIENSHDVIYMLTAEGIFTFVSPAWTILLGHPVDQVIGRSFQEFVAPEDLPGCMKFLKAVIGTGTRQEGVEYRVRHLDGRWFWHTSSAVPIRNESGNVTGFEGTARDITGRKLAEESLFAEKERLSVTLASIADGVITTDINGNVLILNKVAENLCGWKLNEAAGQPVARIFKIVNERTGKAHENILEKVLHSGEIIELEDHSILVSRDGTERIIGDSAAPIKDSQGKILGAVVIFRDLTEKQRLIETFQRNQKLESLGIFAGGIAHDFNNLLSVIYGNMQLIKGNPDSHEVSESLESCLNTMKRAKAITAQLLTFAKGGAPVKKPGKIDQFIQDTVKFALSGSNCIPEFKIESGLWPLEFDENQIGQVFDNIVINAIQAMPDGGKLDVYAGNENIRLNDHPNLPPGNYIKIIFKDNGTGIAEDVLPRIFDPYFTTKQSGRGLGLASSNSIVNKHDGCIDVESVQGKGTTVNVYLPSDCTAPAENPDKPEALIKGNGKILVMDDEPDLRKVLMKMLRLCGYTSEGAENGEDVLAILSGAELKNEKFEAVILDLTIPGGMGGKETVKEILKLYPELPVFVYSGYSDDPIMMDPQKYGFKGSLNKPFEIDELAKLLKLTCKEIS